MKRHQEAFFVMLWDKSKAASHVSTSDVWQFGEQARAPPSSDVHRVTSWGGVLQLLEEHHSSPPSLLSALPGAQYKLFSVMAFPFNCLVIIEASVWTKMFFVFLFVFFF